MRRVRLLEQRTRAPPLILTYSTMMLGATGFIGAYSWPIHASSSMPSLSAAPPGPELPQCSGQPGHQVEAKVFGNDIRIDSTMMPGATGFIVFQNVAGSLSTLGASELPRRFSAPPGLELLQSSGHTGHQVEENVLSNIALSAIRRLMQERTDKLGEAYLQGKAVDLRKVVFDVTASDGESTHRRNLLQDIVVLTLAECNKCNHRADFEAALKDMFGDKFTTAWRSRFHGSVFHILRRNGIPCFNSRTKSKSGPKTKAQLQVMGHIC